MKKCSYLLQGARACLRLIYLLVFIGFSGNLLAQETLEGTVADKQTGETLIGATVIVKGTTQGTTTDIDGKFKLQLKNPLPVTLTVGYVGYVSQDVTVSDASKPLKINLSTNQVIMKEVQVVGQRISEKQKQAPLTVESMDVIAVKEAPSGSFYEGLGSMKGVDLTSASMGFKVLNTRGFNSTSPVRSLQLIDGVDNQSPGLNFSLGNFLGAADLDVMKVDVIAGASSAFYGPGAFNGVINITTKDTFVFHGLDASVKFAERNMKEFGVRWADVFKDKNGTDRFAYKINLYYLTANDWKANNYNPIYQSDVPASNPGRYDAINIYGDEEFSAANNNFTLPSEQLDYPGLGHFYRSGYKESDLVDYSLKNIKFNTSLHYRIKPTTELIYGFNYSTGNTVYQGDNRYRLKDIQFFQNKLELNHKDKWFVRAYSTREDAGKTYDIVQTAFLLNKAQRDDQSWNTAYKTLWKYPYNGQPSFANRVQNLPGYPTYSQADYGTLANWATNYLDPFLQQWNDSLSLWHAQNLQRVNNTSSSVLQPFYKPGTARFDSLYNVITSNDFAHGGSRFYDKSALYNLQGEYKFKPVFGTITVGASGRLYTPETNGTIFSDSLQYTRKKYLKINQSGNTTLIDPTTISQDSIQSLQTNYNASTVGVPIDSSYRKITNWQIGFYAGLDKDFMDHKLKLNATVRVDKNQNFKFLASPAVSLVYSPNKNNTFRATFTSAIRNPTLADQYLYYNVGRAILLGNIDGLFAPGRDSLVTLQSFDDYRNSSSLASGLSKLRYIHVDAIKPEKVKTVEVGYRGTLLNHLYVDASTYYSVYTDFIGYIIGIQAKFDPNNGFPIGGIQPYRLAANALGKVTTQGAAIGLNYYFLKYTLSGNYSWNKLISGADDPIIPAYNTPENKYNLGFSGRDLRIFKKPNWGFSANYKWVQGFLFEGSPQFTGFINSYGMVDAQINYTLKLGKKKVTSCFFKLGASNLLDNQVFQVYGGPTIGRLAYISVEFNWNRK